MDSSSIRGLSGKESALAGRSSFFFLASRSKCKSYKPSAPHRNYRSLVKKKLAYLFGLPLVS
jgi:hypothetical protein